MVLHKHGFLKEIAIEGINFLEPRYLSPQASDRPDPGQARV
jgi:hypothetical protein